MHIRSRAGNIQRCFLTIYLFPLWQHNRKECSFANLAFNRYRPAQQPRKVLGDGES